MNDAIATIIPNLREETQEQYDAVDPGAIRADILTELSKTYKVEQTFDCFIINENAEINLSDALIKDLFLLHGFNVSNFVDMIVQQYDYLMTNTND